MKRFLVLGALVLAGCQTTGPVDPIKPKANPEKVMRTFLNETLKDPRSLQDLKVSRYFKMDERNIWRGHYAICASYRATNSYGGYMLGTTILVVKPNGTDLAQEISYPGRPTSPACLAAL